MTGRLRRYRKSLIAAPRGALCCRWFAPDRTIRSASGGNGAVLDDLDETIKTVLRERGGLPTAEVDIAFDAPDREWSGRINRPTVNCYLYDIRENLELRESGWTTERDLN